MSYSFNARAATKAEAMKSIVVELDKVVALQPVHGADRDQAQAAAEAFLGVITEDVTKDVYVSVSGWVGWDGKRDEHSLTSASVNVSVSLIDKTVK